MDQKRRIEYIDLAKAFAIIFVLIGHTVSSDTFIKKVVYAFHMPLFMVLSGSLIRVSDRSFTTFLKDRALRLLVPYFIWAMIYSPFSLRNLICITYGTRQTLEMASSLTSLWFLPTMFISQCITYFFLKKALKKQAVILLPPLILFIVGIIASGRIEIGYPWGLDVAFVTVLFMISGNLLTERMQNTNVIVLSGCFVSCIFAYTVSLRFNTTDLGYVLMANAIYGNPVLFLIGAYGGSVAIILISYLLSKVDFPLKRCFLHVGQKTFGIFLIHKPIVESLRVVMEKLGIGYNSFTGVLLITVIGLAISYGLAQLIEWIVPSLFGIKKDGIYEQ